MFGKIQALPLSSSNCSDFLLFILSGLYGSAFKTTDYQHLINAT